jgi:hypothetical protein
MAFLLGPLLNVGEDIDNSWSEQRSKKNKENHSPE